MTMKMVLTTVALAGVLAGPIAASAKTPLREVAVVHDGLLAVGIADEIRKKCDSISPRMFTAMSFMSSLKRTPRDMGYSDDEIEAYVTSKEEKARMRAEGEKYLKANGVNRANPKTFCDLGRAEIAKGSQIGKFLKAR